MNTTADAVTPEEPNARTTARTNSRTNTRTDEQVLPWWRSPLNVGVLVVAAILLAAALGFVVGNNRALADPDAIDVGFLQDMRVHHEQAVQLSFVYLDTDPNGEVVDSQLATVARDILVGQNMEIGRMIQLLRSFGEPEVNDTGLAMAWMGAAMPLDRMPGLATQADIDAFVAARGADADAMFVRLMSEHHRGGIHMAEHAADHAATAEVRLMASQMASGQLEEIDEMDRLLAASSA